jgi:hypothetical protein
MEKNIPKFYLISSFLFIFTISAFSQDWTEPINISNMPGLDLYADLYVAKNGVFHCVFVHEIDYTWRKIFYTKSINAGASWTTPIDISLNDDLECSQPHIVSDTNNQLYVCYDYDVGDPENDLVYFKKYDGIQWSEPFVVSEGMPGSDQNRIAIDSENRFYCFWYSDQGGGKIRYRFLENQIWSDIYNPYPTNELMILGALVVDPENNLYCVGGIDTTTYWGENIIFYKYLKYNNSWSDITYISWLTIGDLSWMDIDINNENYPGITWRQKSPDVPGQDGDSTMYSFYNGSQWSEPELVVNDPKQQRLVYDNYNNVHIVDYEKMGDGYKLVHYQKINGLWQGYIVDIANNILFPDLEIFSNTLLLVYNKSAIPQNADVYFCKYNIITGLNQEHNGIIFTEMNLFPNPFKDETNIDFGINKQGIIELSVYDIEGKLISKMFTENKLPDTYRTIWNGKDLNGKEVKPGLYIVRLLSGRNIVTKPVEKLK